MKKVLSALRSKVSKVATAVGLLSFGVAASAQTSLPTWTTTLATDADTAVTDVMALVGPIIGAVIIAIVTLKLIKRFSSKI